MISYCMSTEQFNKNSDTQLMIDSIEAVEVKKKRPQRVDINNLIERVREEKKKEKKENLIFISLIASAVLITGAIASF